MSYQLHGPFIEYRVIVDGCRVPLLKGQEIDGGQINLVFDDRLCVLLDAGVAESVVPFVASVIRACLDYKFNWPEVLGISQVETDSQGETDE